MLAIARSNAADFNWGRAFAYAAFFVIVLMALVEPAFAQGAFGELETKIVKRTEDAFETGRKIPDSSGQSSMPAQREADRFVHCAKSEVEKRSAAMGEADDGKDISKDTPNTD